MHRKAICLVLAGVMAWPHQGFAAYFDREDSPLGAWRAATLERVPDGNSRTIMVDGRGSYIRVLGTQYMQGGVCRLYERNVHGAAKEFVVSGWACRGDYDVGWTLKETYLRDVVLVPYVAPPPPPVPQPAIAPARPPAAATADWILPASERWIVIASRTTVAEAQEELYRYRPSFPEATVFQAQNGWYAVTIGKAPRAQAIALRDELMAKQLIPQDSGFSNGKNYVARIATPARTPAAPVRQQEAAADNSGEKLFWGVVAVGVAAAVLWAIFGSSGSRDKPPATTVRSNSGGGSSRTGGGGRSDAAATDARTRRDSEIESFIHNQETSGGGTSGGGGGGGTSSGSAGRAGGSGSTSWGTGRVEPRSDPPIAPLYDVSKPPAQIRVDPIAPLYDNGPSAPTNPPDKPASPLGW